MTDQTVLTKRKILTKQKFLTKGTDSPDRSPETTVLTKEQAVLTTRQNGLDKQS